MTYKILVLEGITERGLEVLKAEGWEVDQRKAMPAAEIAAIIEPFHALTIRSGSNINEAVTAAAKNLRVIGRPGVGVDNVDVEAATRHGIVVMNSPMGNLASTAELTFALLLAVARNIAQADASLKAGKWDRKAFAGAELSGKNIGVIGFGRIGREVANRCRAFGMEVFAFDPFVLPATIEALGARALSFDELLARSDFITLHTTMSKETKNLMDAAAFAKLKPGARIVNAARGELIDEAALLAALDSGKVAGAGLDVHGQEPPVDWRLAQHPKVVATPHIGAQTKEAQERVGTDIAYQVRDFLKGGVISQAVNFFSLSGDLYDQVRPAMDLASRLGSFLSQTATGAVQRIEIGLYGELRDIDPKPILPAAVAGVLRGREPGSITYVNAMAKAQERHIAVVQSTSASPVAFSSLIAMRVKTAEDDVSVAGAIVGGDHIRLVEIDGVEVDTIPDGHILYVRNDDTPGVVGHIGVALGEEGVNIARMTVGRKPGSGRAVMLIEVDSAVGDDTVAKVRKVAGVRDARAIALG